MGVSEAAKINIRSCAMVKEPDEASMEAAARETAHDLIQGYLGPDHKVINMQAFYSALVQALKAARKQGHADRETEGEESRSSAEIVSSVRLPTELHGEGRIADTSVSHSASSSSNCSA